MTIYALTAEEEHAHLCVALRAALVMFDGVPEAIRGRVRTVLVPDGVPAALADVVARHTLCAALEHRQMDRLLRLLIVVAPEAFVWGGSGQEGAAWTLTGRVKPLPGGAGAARAVHVVQQGAVTLTGAVDLGPEGVRPSTETLYGAVLWALARVCAPEAVKGIRKADRFTRGAAQGVVEEWAGSEDSD